MSDDKRPVLELRGAAVAEVRFPERTITLLAVPYESPTPDDKPVVYRGKLYREVFRRGSFDGIEQRSDKIRVNREHRKGDTVGKAVRFDPYSQEGLITELRMVASPRGDETLALAAEDMLSPSVGFGVRGSDQAFDPRSKPYPTRYVNRAFLDHIALVEDPAYTGAEVIDVRGDQEFVNAANLPPLHTPLLDKWTAYLAARQAGVAS
jgi:HK97 family phage prohead protease